MHTAQQSQWQNFGQIVFIENALYNQSSLAINSMASLLSIRAQNVALRWVYKATSVEGAVLILHDVCVIWYHKEITGISNDCIIVTISKTIHKYRLYALYLKVEKVYFVSCMGVAYDLRWSLVMFALFRIQTHGVKTKEQNKFTEKLP